MTERITLAAIVAGVAFALYVPTFDFGWTYLDDDALIINDARFLAHAAPIPDAFQRRFFPEAGGGVLRYYRPLVTATFMYDEGTDEAPVPSKFHRTNAWLHAITCVLLFELARRLTARIRWAAAVALLFAVHPASVQTVAWVPGRSDGLMAVFALASTLAWVSFDRSGSRKALGCHLGMLGAALLSKETAVAIVPIVLAYSLLVTQRRERVQSGRVWLGWAVTLAFWLALRARYVGALGLDAATFVHNVPTLCSAFGKLVVPVDLHVLATLRDSSWWPGLVALCALALIALRLGPTQRRVYAWGAVLVPLLTLAPTLFVSNDLVLDNRLYLPLAGLSLALTSLAEPVYASRGKHLWLAGGLLAMLALGSVTLRYSRVFASPRTFDAAAVAGSPHLALAHLNFGSTLYRQRDFAGAEQQFRLALSLDACWPAAHNNLGVVFLDRGDLVDAEHEFLAELECNPDYTKAHSNLGHVLTLTGRADAARPHFERIVQIDPGNIDAWGELLQYWAPRDPKRASEIMGKMRTLGVVFRAPTVNVAPGNP